MIIVPHPSSYIWSAFWFQLYTCQVWISKWQRCRANEILLTRRNKQTNKQIYQNTGNNTTRQVSMTTFWFVDTQTRHDENNTSFRYRGWQPAYATFMVPYIIPLLVIPCGIFDIGKPYISGRQSVMSYCVRRMNTSGQAVEYRRHFHCAVKLISFPLRRPIHSWLDLNEMDGLNGSTRLVYTTLDAMSVIPVPGFHTSL